MSDDWIVLVPEDPLFVPPLEKQFSARDRFAQIAPDAEEIKIYAGEGIQLFDAGENLMAIYCPSCKGQISVEWWLERVDEDNTGNGFELRPYPAPCCRQLSSLQGLVYDWNQAFGSFAIEAMNANIGLLEDRYIQEFEQILGTKLVVVYQHI
jgi:hypothetical protein